MKHLKFLIIHIILITINIKLIFTHDPALKINLNPPEEDVKDTIGIQIIKLVLNRGYERHR